MKIKITSDQRARINAVISFWFPDGWDRHTTLTDKIYDRWFSGTPQLDMKMRNLFVDDLEAIVRNEREHWIQDRDGCLAYVLLCDQFARNIYRGDPRAFRTDSRSLAAVRTVVGNEQKWGQYKNFEKMYLIFPLAHQEDSHCTQESVTRYRDLAVEINKTIGKNNAAYRTAVSYLSGAEGHHATVLKYGRFPHRNRVLNRENSSREKGYTGPYYNQVSR